ncbi:phytanoyl-CoA dioxygenase family protein [Pleomorphovibrio marinus]|uniref:phytanoyl-CoA dioxygenase family protein n=1 Tax=Pleomorphovibrio marinus TaxID=2164132 RepID=UPI000E0C37C7|nr:phytanoyl-CoA dioxygenase family protein [Pleomorphovibrio marinus]
MNHQTLQNLGVKEDSLTQEERSFLDENGYLNLGKLLSDVQLAQIQDKINLLLELEGENAGKELVDSPFIRHPKESGADRLGDLVNKGVVFDIFYTHPKVLAAVSHVLGANLKLSSLNYRAAKPGAGLQKLHADYPDPVPTGDYRVCNSIWLLDDFSASNGATRIVPGSHKSQSLPEDTMEDPMAPHPEEQILHAPAGSVVIFNSHTWHGGTTNQTDKPRRAIHSYFCRRDQPQQIHQKTYILEETLSRIPKEAALLLDVV